MPAPVEPVEPECLEAVEQEKQRILDLIEAERVPERGPFTKHQNYAIDHLIEVITRSKR
jgi:hypothetical protein